jgi:hypothetical protein
MENLSQDSRKVPGGHDLMWRHGGLLAVAKQFVNRNLPALGDLGQQSISVDINRAA